jgi:hypothetical protein
LPAASPPNPPEPLPEVLGASPPPLLLPASKPPLDEDAPSWSPASLVPNDPPPECEQAPARPAEAVTTYATWRYPRIPKLPAREA